MVPPISYTRAKLYEQCPARFKAEYLDGKKPERGLPLRVGVFLHEVLDRYFKHLIATDQASDYPAMERIFEEAWAGEPGQDFIESDRDEIVDLMVKTRESILLEDRTRVVGSEVMIAVDEKWIKVDWDSPLAAVRLKIDRLEVDSEGRALVWDYKTGHKMEEAEDSRQLKLYGAIVRAVVPGITAVAGELFYARQQKLKRAQYSDDELADALRWIISLRVRLEESMRQGYWPERIGAGCMECPVSESCGARAKLQPGELPPRNKEEAQELLARFIGVDRDYTSLQERLRLWISINGPLELGGVVVEMAPKEILEFPLERLEVSLKSVGQELLRFVKADNTKLKAAARKDPELRRQLSIIAIDKSRTDFKMRRL